MDVRAPDRLGETRLRDGRALGWAEWGPADGVPVLFCPGAATSRWLGFGADAVDALGVRLVSVDRPGLGASDADPGRTLPDFARDVADLAAARGLRGLRGVGFSQGAPFVLACAAAGVVEAAAVVSGTDELAHPDTIDGLVPEVRALVAHAVADPGAAERDFAAFGSAERMWQMVGAGSGEADRAIYTDPGFAPLFRRALAEAFARGAGGYARDTVLAMGRWPFDPGAIAVPVHLWYGALDTSPVHAPDLGERLAARIPGARRTVVPGEGGAILWTRAREILAALVGRPA